MGTDAKDWDSYFLDIAKAVSKKSKDSCKVGAVITSDHLIISTGFNGLPRHLSNELEIEVIKDREEKLAWVVHAEENAILNAARVGARTVGGTIYVNKFPCYRCLQAIIQVGITRIYTDDDGYWDGDPSDNNEHHGKKFLIAAAKLQVEAPNHQDFAPMPPPRISRRPRPDSVPPSAH